MPRDPSKVDTRPAMVAYTVRACTIMLPGTGSTQAYAVVRVWDVRADSPAVATFIHGSGGAGRAHAEHYASFLTQNQIEVI